MLPAANRLKPSRHVTGRKVESSQFKIIYNRADILKAAVVISKKVAPKAHDRSRIKRTITEALRTRLDFTGEIMIIVKENIASLTAQQVASSLKMCLKRV